MSDALAKYNAAKRALSLAVNIDEVKDIRDKAVALRTYAMQAKDRELIDHATEIRLRAERRAGELLRNMEKNKGARASGSNQHELRSHDATTPKLNDLGVNKSQSSRWQQLAALDNEDFEDRIIHAQQKASAAVDHQPKPKTKPKAKPNGKAAAKSEHDRDVLDQIARFAGQLEGFVERSALGTNTEKRQALFDVLTSAFHKILTIVDPQKASALEEDPDRWIEA